MDFASEIAKIIETAAHEKKVLLLLSGGSSVGVGVRALSLLLEEARKRITVGLTDERYGEHNHADSNWHALETQNFMQYPVSAYIPVLSTENLTMEETASRYEAALRTHITEDTSIVALFGIGKDNHIAGILPESPASRAEHALVTSYDAGVFKRITITPAFFRHISVAMVYAEGEEKKEAIDALSTEHDTVSHPDQLVRRAGSFKIFFKN